MPSSTESPERGRLKENHDVKPRKSTRKRKKPSLHEEMVNLDEYLGDELPKAKSSKVQVKQEPVPAPISLVKNALVKVTTSISSALSMVLKSFDAFTRLEPRHVIELQRHATKGHVFSIAFIQVYQFYRDALYYRDLAISENLKLQQENLSKKAELEKQEDELLKLKKRINQLEEALAECDGDKSRLREENLSLRFEMDAIKRQNKYQRLRGNTAPDPFMGAPTIRMIPSNEAQASQSSERWVAQFLK